MENLTCSNYQQFKQVLDTVINRTVEDFVIIGYLLNKAATTDILLESGYANVNEMAEKEYKLDASQTSRFINIYREFGVEGQPMLQEKYKEHGVAKLGLMLTMPECVRDEISADFSKREINELKKIVEEEKKITDIEVMCEEKDAMQQLLPEGFKQLVMQFVRDYPEEYIKIYDAITLDDLKEIMAPNGECVFKIRVPGVGLHLLFAKSNENMVVTNARTGEKDSYEWEQFFEALKDYFVMGTDAKASWSNIFQEPYPEPVKEEPKKTENADKHNVQQAKPKKESKVKTPKPKKEPQKEPKSEPKVEEPVKEEQLPGQKTIMDYPEYLPESMKEDKPEVLKGEIIDGRTMEEVSEEPANTDNNNVQQAQEGMKVEYIAPVQNSDNANVIRGYKAGIKAALNVAINKCDQNDWSAVIAKATDVVWRAKRIQELEGKN